MSRPHPAQHVSAVRRLRRNPSVKLPPTFTTPVIVVGNGGSCDEMPPEFWQQDVAYIGTNRCLAVAACRNVEWSALVMRDSYRKMFTVDDHGWQYHGQLWKPATAWKVGSAHDRGVWCDEYVRQVDGWQFERAEDHNREAAVIRNSSVVLMAANWAWIQGARDIRLIGVDYRLPHHAKMFAPWSTKPQGDVQQYARPVPPGIEKQFKRARMAIESAGGSITNLSPGTSLQAVPTGKEIHT